MNLNKGCIEIAIQNSLFPIQFKMNLNKGCIEISYSTKHTFFIK